MLDKAYMTLCTCVGTNAALHVSGEACRTFRTSSFLERLKNTTAPSVPPSLAAPPVPPVPAAARQATANDP